MLKANREGMYYVVKGNKELVIEVLRTPDGKSFAAIHMTFEGRYKIGDEEKDWYLFDLGDFKAVKDTKLDYKSLPPDVRRAVTEVFR